MSDRIMFADRSRRIFDAWIPLLLGLAVVFALFHLLAHAVGSDRGQAGFVVAAAVILALVAVERMLFGVSLAAALKSLGFGHPATIGLTVAIGLSVVLLCVIPGYAALRGISPAVYPGWMWLLPGLFAQAGVAEEALFRGYLFRHLREGRTFWNAAALAAVPFILVHLIMFATLPWPVALAAVLLSTIIAFPLAHLFELGGKTIWAPALLHFTVQGAIKIMEMPGDGTLPLVWMVACAIVPFSAFLFRRSSSL